SASNLGQVIPLIIPTEKAEENEPEITINKSEPDLPDEASETSVETDSSHVPKDQLINKLRKLRPKWSDDE
ncbi:MAG TPA: hypothetical protein VIQ31_22290, partial [Phormidium sp.]